jgi:hypothetical protein
MLLMPVPNPYPYVKSATLLNNVITLTLEFDHPDSGSYVEISGSATQTGGAYANFYGVTETTSGLTDPTGPNPTATVSANPQPGPSFTAGEDITFVIEVGAKWLTVLSVDPNSTSEGTTWDNLKRWSHVVTGPSGGSPGNSPQPARPAS